MKDRMPGKPGHVIMHLDDGTTISGALVMDDEPTQEGDPLTKSTLLKDTTAALFGLSASAVPDEVFVAIADYINNDAPRVEHGSYVGTGTVGSSNYNRITFQRGIPKLVIIVQDDVGIASVFVNAGSKVWTYEKHNSGGICVPTWSISKELRWYASDYWLNSTTGASPTAADQLNASGVRYRYVAIFG